MNRTAWAVSATLWENDPSPQSPSESPSPRLSKRSMPMPSPASCLQIRLAAGLSLPRVKPWENTPQPRTSPSGWSTSPARMGPLVLGNHTRSATRVILSSTTVPHAGVVVVREGDRSEGAVRGQPRNRRRDRGAARVRRPTRVCGYRLAVVLRAGVLAGHRPGGGHGVRVVPHPGPQGWDIGRGAAGPQPGAGRQAARVAGRTRPGGCSPSSVCGRHCPSSATCSSCPRGNVPRCSTSHCSCCAGCCAKRPSPSPVSSSRSGTPPSCRNPQGKIDIWLGGSSAAGYRRIGSYGDGWLGSFLTPAETREAVGQIRAAAEAAGREVPEDHYGINLAVGDGELPAPVLAAIRKRRPTWIRPSWWPRTGRSCTVGSTSTSRRGSPSS